MKAYDATFQLNTKFVKFFSKNLIFSQGWHKKPDPKNPTQKTRKKPSEKNPRFLGFLLKIEYFDAKNFRNVVYMNLKYIKYPKKHHGSLKKTLWGVVETLLAKGRVRIS